MTKEQLVQVNNLEKYLRWVNERYEKLTKNCGKFDININVSNGSVTEYIDVMSFLSK